MLVCLHKQAFFHVKKLKTQKPIPFTSHLTDDHRILRTSTSNFDVKIKKNCEQTSTPKSY